MISTICRTLWGDVSVESYGSIVIALFWSFVASTMDTSSAKRGYPIIISGAQCGSVLGAFMMMTLPNVLGVPLLTSIAAVSVLIIPIMIKLFTVHHAKAFIVPGVKETKKPTGMIEGLKLICTKPYLM